jgi:hypothetical protein
MDADTMLEAGTHPLGVVRKAAEELPPGEALLLTSSFRPEPLIGALANAGFAVYSRATGPSRHETLIVGRGPKRGGQ